MSGLIDQLQRSSLHWNATDDNPYVFRSTFHGKTILLRLNDFPDEPLCTLIIDGNETNLHEFSNLWSLPQSDS